MMLDARPEWMVYRDEADAIRRNRRNKASYIAQIGIIMFGIAGLSVLTGNAHLVMPLGLLSLVLVGIGMLEMVNPQ